MVNREHEASLPASDERDDSPQHSGIGLLDGHVFVVGIGRSLSSPNCFTAVRCWCSHCLFS